MKKVYLILLLLFVSFVGRSQTVDTLWMGGPREPVLYYWDSNWVDCYMGKLTTVIKSTGSGAKNILARPCLVNRDSLIVIGAAVAAEISDDLTGVADTSVESMTPEYLIFYDNSGPTEMVAMAKTRYDTCRHMRHRIELLHRSQGSSYDYYPFLREAYLEAPLVVRDSFYLGMTMNNHARVYTPGGTYQDYHFDHRGYLFYFTGPIMWPYDSSFYHHPPYYRHRAQIPVPPNSHDTVWHTQSSALWVVVFPIFDTTGYYIHEDPPADTMPYVNPCDSVTGFRIMEQEPESVTLTWNTDGHSLWELSFAPEGTPPDQGVRSETAAPFACISDCDTAVPYRAFVRTVCDSGSRSDWGSGIPFTLSGTHTSVGLADIDDLTWVAPNPASTAVRVVSSYHIREIAVYSADGQLALRQPVYALEKTLDLTSLTKGLYMVVIRTAYGDTVRKLAVVK